MIETETMLTFAEIAMGLMGVSGLVAVFMSQGPLSSADKIRFAIIVLGCCNMALFAYMPIWLARHVSELADIWRYCSMIALTIWFCGNIGVQTYARKSGAMRPLLDSATPTFLGAMFIGLAAMVLLLVANIVGWPGAPGATQYKLFLMVLLYQLGLQFLSLVVFRVPDPREQTSPVNNPPAYWQGDLAAFLRPVSPRAIHFRYFSSSLIC